MCTSPINLTTDWNEKTLTDSGKPSVSVLKLGSSMKMTVSTRGHLPLVRMALSLGSREWEVMTRETCTASLTPAPHPELLLPTSVSWMPWQMASSPRLV